jgi:hypothetical protein
MKCFEKVINWLSVATADRLARRGPPVPYRTRAAFAGVLASSLGISYVAVPIVGLMLPNLKTLTTTLACLV